MQIIFPSSTETLASISSCMKILLDYNRVRNFLCPQYLNSVLSIRYQLFSNWVHIHVYLYTYIFLLECGVSLNHHIKFFLLLCSQLAKHIYLCAICWFMLLKFTSLNKNNHYWKEIRLPILGYYIIQYIYIFIPLY